MSVNALVSGPVETESAAAGLGVVESVYDLSQALQSGSWLAVGLTGVGAALDVAAAVVDPLGSLIAAGLGWIMEHLQPLKGWLNDLTGDSAAVAGFAATWDNIATAMGAAGDELARVVRADLEGMAGASIIAYATYANGLAERLRATKASAGSVAGALRTCAMVVQAVHDVVRDTLAQLVGSIISWAAEALLTLGLATPVIVGQVSTRVSSLATRIGKSVTDVITSAKALKNLVGALKDALVDLARSARHGAAGAADDMADAARRSGREYLMSDGTTHVSRFASEQAGGHTARGIIDDILGGRAPIDWKGHTPWTYDQLVGKVMTPVDHLSNTNRAILRQIADAMPTPRVGDVVQKVLTPHDFEHLVSSVSPAVKGSVARFDDVSGLDSLTKLHDALRLDYPGTPFRVEASGAQDGFQVLRTELTDAAPTSRNSLMGGDGSTDRWLDPYTGNGFLKSDDLIPEYRAPVQDLPPGAEIWEITAQGTERLTAVLREGVGWIRVR